MKFNKFALIGKALKLLKPLSKIYNAVKGIGKTKKTDDMSELREEIKLLREDVKKHENKIKELTTKEIIKKEEKTKSKEWIQAELYVSVVTSGDRNGGSESAGYILINLPFDEYQKVKSKFNTMDSSKLKEMLDIEDDKILKNVAHGETLSETKERFIEINGERKPFKESDLE